MKRFFYIALFLLSVILSSCFEEDQHLTPIPIDKIEIPYSMYEYQTYYNISESSIVQYNYFDDWDLGFESSENGYHIILNYSRYMYAGNTYETNFAIVNESTSAEMYFDKSDGNPDSTVFVDWADFSNPTAPIFNNYVYVVDRGKNELGEDYGFKKIQIEKLENDTFYVHFSNLDNTEDAYIKVPKNKSSNYTLVSLDNGGEIIVTEPGKETWDVCFTKYSTRIPDNDGVLTDYIVRGVYLNPYKSIEVGLDSINNFYDISSEMVNEYTFSGLQDALGYDWKYYEDDVYNIRDLNSYILKNVNGLNYKIRFVSFYNDKGEKGFPAFELLEL